MAVDVQVKGLNQLLRALNRFPKEAGAELRQEANKIASDLMLPSWQRAARQVSQGKGWGDVLAGSMRVKRDRVPAIQIGYQRRVLSGGHSQLRGLREKGISRRPRGTSGYGASSIMLRWPTHSGDDGASFFDFARTGWINQATGYKAEAMDRYGDAVERVVRKWNTGLG